MENAVDQYKFEFQLLNEIKLKDWRITSLPNGQYKIDLGSINHGGSIIFPL